MTGIPKKKRSDVEKKRSKRAQSSPLNATQALGMGRKLGKKRNLIEEVCSQRKEDFCQLLERASLPTLRWEDKGGVK